MAPNIAMYHDSTEHQSFTYIQLNSQTVLFLTIGLNIKHVICLHTFSMSNSSIWPIDRTLSGVTTLGQNEPGSNGNEEVLHIPWRSKGGASPSDCLASYPENSWRGGEFYPSAEMQLVYFTAPADWAIFRVNLKVLYQLYYPILPSVTETTATVSSNLGMMTSFIGTTLALLIIRVQNTSSSSIILMYEHWL